MNPAKARPASDLAYLCRALKGPSLLDAAARLAERARTDTWSHEEYLAACLEREVAARQSHGGDARVRAARLPARKALEEFDYDHQYEHDLVRATRPGKPVLRGAADIHVGIAGILLERGDLAGAIEHLSASQALGEELGLPQHPWRWRVAAARIRQAEGDLDAALGLIEEAEPR